MPKKYLALFFFVLPSFWLDAGEVLYGRFAHASEGDAVFRSKLSIEIPTTTENTDVELILSITYTEQPSIEVEFREEILLKLEHINNGDVLFGKASDGGSLNFLVIAEVLAFGESRNYVFHNCVIPSVMNSNYNGLNILQLLRIKNYGFDIEGIPILSTPSFLP